VRARWLGLGLGALAACDGLGDGRLQRLEEEVRSLRAAHASAPTDVAAALIPLRDAIDGMVQRSAVERTRWSALTQEILQLTGVMQGFVDENRRAEIEALRTRVLELEQQAKDQAKTQGEERELLLRALDATAGKLEAFLRRVEVRKGTSEPLTGFDAWRSLTSGSVLWPIGGAVVVALALYVWSRRGRAAPRVRPLDPPEAVVDAPEFGLAAPERGLAAVPQSRRPIALGVEVKTSSPAPLPEPLLRWLQLEPRVLQQPPPVVQGRGSTLCVQFFVQDSLPLAERASLIAEVRARGQSETVADRRSA